MNSGPLDILIVGGGPSGLYLATLLKKGRPEHRVRVLERNRLGDAYGFGVVFSDETLDNFEDADDPSFQELARSFRHWGDIKVHHPDGRTFLSGGHGFAAVSRRRLLEILSARAADVGVELDFSAELTDFSELPNADLIVGADGANSVVRRHLSSYLEPSIDVRSNRYIWFGTPKVFDEFNFIFEDTPAGMVWAHVYPYSEEGSTFIVEMAPETWRALGFDQAHGQPLAAGTNDEFALSRCVELFKRHLEGRGLIGNNSKWLQFPTVSCARWHHGNVVLMGDAIHTAHFSVGSGTKLAMEDAIALSRLFLDDVSMDQALDQYERLRRPDVQSLQRAARASLEWFEGADRYRSVDPEASGSPMTTSGFATPPTWLR
jgi:anthraniloyl-CoA monooxygenase